MWPGRLGTGFGERWEMVGGGGFLAAADLVGASETFEGLAGVGDLDVFDGGAFGSEVEIDVFSSEGDFFPEGEADPVVGEEEPFAGAGSVSLEDDAEEVLDFAFRVFGAEEDIDEGGDGLAVVDADFEEDPVVEEGGVEVVDDLKPTGEVSFVLPCAVVDAEAFDEVVVLELGVVFEGEDGLEEGLGCEAVVSVAAVIFDFEELVSEGSAEFGRFDAVGGEDVAHGSGVQLWRGQIYSGLGFSTGLMFSAGVSERAGKAS